MPSSIYCVLRSGGDYAPIDAQLLYQRCKRWAPAANFLCLTDFVVPGVPCAVLAYDFPGWWAKLEAFKTPAGRGAGTRLIMDLDTVPIGPLDDLLAIDRLAMLSDFYFPINLASGVMVIPDGDRREVWDRFTADPFGIMDRCRTYDAKRQLGDGKFIAEVYGDRPARLQDLCPGQIVSYKIDVRGLGKPPAGARLVCFHGSPRPREIKEDWMDQ